MVKELTHALTKVLGAEKTREFEEKLQLILHEYGIKEVSKDVATIGVTRITEDNGDNRVTGDNRVAQDGDNRVTQDGDNRVTQDGDNRVTQDGDNRVTQDGDNDETEDGDNGETGEGVVQGAKDKGTDTKKPSFLKHLTKLRPKRFKNNALKKADLIIDQSCTAPIDTPSNPKVDEMVPINTENTADTIPAHSSTQDTPNPNLRVAHTSAIAIAEIMKSNSRPVLLPKPRPNTYHDPEKAPAAVAKPRPNTYHDPIDNGARLDIDGIAAADSPPVDNVATIEATKPVIKPKPPIKPPSRPVSPVKDGSYREPRNRSRSPVKDLLTRTGSARDVLIRSNSQKSIAEHESAELKLQSPDSNDRMPESQRISRTSSPVRDDVAREITEGSPKKVYNSGMSAITMALKNSSGPMASALKSNDETEDPVLFLKKSSASDAQLEKV
jgi:hypothetical protein